MSVVAPPPHDENELLIHEARARQRRRWLGVATLVAVLAGTALAIHSVVSRTHPGSSIAAGGRPVAITSNQRCGIRIVGTRIYAGGRVAYHDPSPSAMWHEVRCRGSTVWVVFVNGVGMMHEEYVGVRSPDRGRTWRVAFAQSPDVHARYGIGAEPGAWTLVGPRAAYFVGACPACGTDGGKTTGTLSLSVTKDGGRTFRTYPVPARSGFEARQVRVSGNAVTIAGRRLMRKVDKPPFEIYEHEAVRVRVA
ncbi:MAG TPA: hypothetical protein VFU33_08085 [Gaiellaceae bacterium]|nr:hypothetical protein [Gaiellaceae bacterium]